MKFTFPKLKEKQLDKLSDIASDIGLVSPASVIFPAVLDKFSLTAVALGTFITFVSWIISLWLRR